ncbi:Rrf2 family transcriptional regulator [Acidocella facilis]|uniref:Rrf2 family transcriptional regulator n=1 Tax=Acidocella facilis TaxID=525 RepID=UPI00047E9F4A|nr:Rrf2 family transcriptional regulator [Acidocella facilis]
MHLTRFTDYGLRTLIYLAMRPDRLAQISDIAAAYRVSENHMTKVVHRLGQAGLIETIRGRQGGMRLAHPPAQIRIGDVVRKLEPDFALVECQGDGSCAIRGACGLERVLDEALAAMLAVLERYTLEDVIAGNMASLRRRLGLALPGEGAPGRVT